MPWSPSSTEKFLSCPMRWWLDRQGAQGRVRDESAMDAGSQFHAVMAHYWEEKPIDLSTCGMTVYTAFEKTIRQEGDALREQGIVCVECVLGGPDDERLRHGRYPGTADLVTDNGSGLTVTDYKTKATLQPAYVDGELRQTQRSWQFKQYAWFVQKKYERPVTHVRKLLVAFKPTLRVWLATYPVTQQELSKWYEQAKTVWELMDNMVEIYPDEPYHVKDMAVWQNADACERYGWQYRCDHYETCWDGAPIVYKEEK